MEFHQTLYKSVSRNISANSPKDRMKKNLRYGQSKRNDIFQQNRIIEPISPTLIKPKHGKAISKDKENEVQMKIGNTEKMNSHQLAYCAKYLAWKQAKEKERALEKAKKRPFVTVCPKNTIIEPQRTFVPSNHKKFNPPANLRNPLSSDKVIFEIQNGVSENKKTPSRNLVSIKKQSENVKTPVTNFISLNKKLASTPKNRKVLITKNKNSPKQKPLNLLKTSTNIDKVLNNPTTSLGNPSQIKKNEFKQPLKKLQAIPKNNKMKNSVTVEKPKQVSIQSPKGSQDKLKRPVVLRKTPFAVKQKRNAPRGKTTRKNATKSKQETQTILFANPKVEIIQETPIDSGEKPSQLFLTSTQRKDGDQVIDNFIPPEENESILSSIESIEPDKKEQKIPLIDLYDGRKSINVHVLKIEDVTSKELGIKPLDNSKSPGLNITPINSNNETITYVSPYVTMSRGKLDRKKEKKLRQSFYGLDDKVENSPQNSEYKRVQQTVKYFKKMLNDEILKLQTRIEEWEKYVQVTNPTILEDCGYDMINVAIGQTRLLITKKFQQFKQLIEDCESFARDRFEMKPISDDTKPILPEDLEGFWQMMYIQVDDIDKRFHSLTLWRNNEWKDPDEKTEPFKAKPKNKLLTKVGKKKKSTALTGPNTMSKIKEMILEIKKKKQQEEILQATKNKENDDNMITLTPSKKSTRRSKSVNESFGETTDSTPIRRSRRLSCVINETPNSNLTPSRKSLRIETAIKAATKIMNESINGTPQRSYKSEIPLINIIKTPCIACPSDYSCSPKPRKSILKTPGTHKKRQTVIFNEELQFQSPEKLSMQTRRQARKRL